MPDKNKSEETPTVITLVLPADTTRPATVTVRNGELGHMSSFAYDGFKDICVALNESLTAFVQVQANPPKDIQSTKPEPKQAKASKKAKKAPGKPPYKLIDAAGNPRTLDKMFDPFELQEKYHKDNPKFKFDDLDEASAVAQLLIDAGLEKKIIIAYSNGETAKVLPVDNSTEATDDAVNSSDDVTPANEPDSDSPEDDEESANDEPAEQVEPAHEVTADDSETDDDTTDGDSGQSEDSYPDALDTVTKRAIYDAVTDEDITLAIYNDIMFKKKHGWKQNLMKQREVKGFIALHVDGKEEVVEQVYQIALDSSEFDDQSDGTEQTTKAKSKAPAVVQVLTSPELAAKNGVPQYQEFSLATDDDENDEISGETDDS